MTNVTKMLSVVALAGFLVVGAGASSVEAKTKCNNDVPPVCKEVRTRGSVTPFYFYKQLGIDISMDQATENFRNPAVRKAVMDQWRAEVFYKGWAERQALKAEKAKARAEARAAARAERRSK